MSFATDLLNRFNTPPLDKVTVKEGLSNSLTGNLDYQRQVEREERAYSYNAAEAQKQRDFEERLSNTALDRQATQLERLGINPTAYFLGGGQGASTPSGVSASGTSGSPKSPRLGVSDILGFVARVAGLAVSAYGAGVSASQRAADKMADRALRERLARMTSTTSSYDWKGSPLGYTIKRWS